MATINVAKFAIFILVINWTLGTSATAYQRTYTYEDTIAALTYEENKILTTFGNTTYWVDVKVDPSVQEYTPASYNFVSDNVINLFIGGIRPLFVVDVLATQQERNIQTIIATLFAGAMLVLCTLAIRKFISGNY